MAIIDILQKLMAHEKSAREIGNLAEAEAYAGKVSELLIKHKLEMSDVAVGEAEAIPEGIEDLVVKGARDAWKAVMVYGIAKGMFCNCLKGQGPQGAYFKLIGEPTNMKAVVGLYNYLVVIAEGLATKHVQAAIDKGLPMTEWRWNARNYKNSYLRGFASAIQGRLMGQVQKLALESKNPGAAMVYVNKNQAAIDNFVRLNIGKLRTGSVSGRNLNAESFRTGRAHGGAVGLTSRGSLGSGN